MKLPIVLVLIGLNVLGTNSQSWSSQIWEDLFGDSDDTSEEELVNCDCVPTYKCYPADISREWACLNTFFSPTLVCCRKPVRWTTVRPPPTQRPNPLGPGRPWGTTKKPTQRPQSPTQRPNGWVVNPWNPTKKPAQKPQTPIQPSHPQPHGEDISQDSTDTDTDCSCMPPNDCYDGGFTVTQHKQGNCKNHNHVCCIGQVQIVTPPPQPQIPSPSQESDSDHTDCNCMPRSECYDGEFSLTQHKQGNCADPSYVCCVGLVQPLTQPPQPQTPSPAPVPQTPSPAPVPTQTQSFTPTPKPSTISSSLTNESCTCTPFYKCYDEETSSNLTSVVDDRISITSLSAGVDNDRTSIANIEGSCPDPNDVCCYNLVKMTAKPIAEDCTEPCVPIQECPQLLKKVGEAQGGNNEAVQELRRSVCSRLNDVLRVCCPAN